MKVTTTSFKQYQVEIELIQQATVSLVDKFEELFKLFFKIIKGLTKQEDIVFRNFYARFKFSLVKLNLTDNQKRELDAFRRFKKDNNTQLLTAEAFQKASSLLKFLLRRINQQDKLAIYTTFKYFQSFYPRKKYRKQTSFKLLTNAVGEIETDKDQHLFFLLKGFDVDNLEEEITITVTSYKYLDFKYLQPLISKSTILYVEHIQKVTDTTFRTTVDSLLTIEPDFLINSTAIGSCFNRDGANSAIFFLSKLVNTLVGGAALKGSLVGYFLDEKVRAIKKEVSPQLNEQIFKEGQKLNALMAAQLGYMEMQKIKQSIRQEHLHYIDKLIDKEKDKNLWIEPTFFSKNYGLQGRIDLLTIEGKKAAKHVVELKSGKAPNATRTIAWKNHAVQVVCYDMLLDDTYGEDREGTASVYYSKQPNNPTPHRFIVSEEREKLEVLKVRNQIVTYIYQLAEPNFSLLESIKQNGIIGLPFYSFSSLKRFQEKYDGSRIASQYYQELVAFTLRELINAKVGNLLKEETERQQNGFAGLWLDSLLTKKQDYRIIYDLKIDLQQLDRENAHIVLNITQEMVHSFRKGDLIILYPKIEEQYSPLENHILKGNIKALNTTSVTVSLFNKQTDYSFLESFEFWAIEPDLFERNYWSTIACLFNVLEISPYKKRILFGHHRPFVDTTYVYNNPSLNDNQNQVIQNALNAKDYYVLQGPPGTGKTSTFLVNFVQEVLKNQQEKIVVLAFTNKAVDKICESFRTPRQGEQGINYLRFGSKQVEDNRLFKNSLQGDNPDNWKKNIQQNQVFVSTVSTFQNRWQLIKRFIAFDTVVIDEASQLTEADIAGIAMLFKRFIMIGDHKQLPAVITQPASSCLTKSEYLHKLSIEDLRISLFERLYKNAAEKGWERSYGQLTTHYRMHEQIAQLVAPHYKKLEVGLPKQTSTTPIIPLPPAHPLYDILQKRIVFLETSSEGALKKNEEEAKLVTFIIEQLLTTEKVNPADIGVIAPFRAQISQIKKHLKSNMALQIMVDTVERFQGEEKKIILFSTTISNPHQIANMQNLDAEETDRKLLVSLSRAAEQLIILGNSGVLSTDKNYKQLIDTIKEQGCYLDFFMPSLYGA